MVEGRAQNLGNDCAVAGGELRFTFGLATGCATVSEAMRVRICVLLMCIASAVVPCAFGQSSNFYIAGGGGSLNSKAVGHAAFGAEKVFSKGIGVGAELGVVTGHDSFALLSINGFYHVPNSSTGRKFDPFLAGGYSAAATIFSSTNNGNLGLGFNYWLHSHLGLRAEFREVIGSRDHLPLIRGGIVFR